MLGFGVGVGSAVINGALSQIYDHPERYSRDQLIVRPFPQFPTGGKTLPELWHDYRTDMISFAGVAVIIFGNKVSPDDPKELIEAGGVYKEFVIAKSQNLFVIPVSPTGWMAEKIFNELEAINFNLKAGDEKLALLAKLKSEKDPDKIIEIIIQIIAKLN